MSTMEAVESKLQKSVYDIFLPSERFPSLQASIRLEPGCHLGLLSGAPIIGAHDELDVFHPILFAM